MLSVGSMVVRVGTGIGALPFSSGKAFFRWVDALEEGGVDSVWQTDRLVSHRPFLESMSTMAAIAGATDRIKFGMNAVVASTRDPLVLAKQCATIDYLSDGRLLPCFGIGDRRAPEFAATSRATKGRGRRADELLTLLRLLWSEEDVSFEGEFFQYSGCTISPRPVQKTLPLWIGGHSKAAISRTARLGTGWLGGLRTPAMVEPIIASIKAELVQHGRTIAEDHYGASFGYRFGSWDEPLAQALSKARLPVPEGFDPRDYYAIGGAAEIIERCRQFVAAGAEKLVLIPIAAGDDELFDQSRRLIEEVIPAVQT